MQDGLDGLDCKVGVFFEWILTKYRDENASWAKHDSSIDYTGNCVFGIGFNVTKF